MVAKEKDSDRTMTDPANTMPPSAPALSLRIDLPNGTRLGPGKATLLRQLIETGSIKAAALDLNMSYPRALKLIEQMNSAFAEPLVETKHGGADGGGAHVTATGQRVLQIYNQVCTTAISANQSAMDELAGLISD